MRKLHALNLILALTLLPGLASAMSSPERHTRRWTPEEIEGRLQRIDYYDEKAYVALLERVIAEDPRRENLDAILNSRHFRKAGDHFTTLVRAGVDRAAFEAVLDSHVFSRWVDERSALLDLSALTAAPGYAREYGPAVEATITRRCGGSMADFFLADGGRAFTDFLLASELRKDPAPFYRYVSDVAIADLPAFISEHRRLPNLYEAYFESGDTGGVSALMELGFPLELYANYSASWYTMAACPSSGPAGAMLLAALDELFSSPADERGTNARKAALRATSRNPDPGVGAYALEGAVSGGHRRDVAVDGASIALMDYLVGEIMKDMDEGSLPGTALLDLMSYPVVLSRPDVAAEILVSAAGRSYPLLPRLMDAAARVGGAAALPVRVLTSYPPFTAWDSSVPYDRLGEILSVYEGRVGGRFLEGVAVPVGSVFTAAHRDGTLGALAYADRLVAAGATLVASSGSSMEFAASSYIFSMGYYRTHDARPDAATLEFILGLARTPEEKASSARRAMTEYAALTRGEGMDPAILDMLVARGAKVDGSVLYTLVKNRTAEETLRSIMAGADGGIDVNFSHRNASVLVAALEGGYSDEFIGTLLAAGADPSWAPGSEADRDDFVAFYRQELPIGGLYPDMVPGGSPVRVGPDLWVAGDDRRPWNEDGRLIAEFGDYQGSDDPRSALVVAMRSRRSPAIVRALVDAGARASDADYLGFNALDYAILYYGVDVARYLAASAPEPDDPGFRPNAFGYTPLMTAMYAGDDETVLYFLRRRERSGVDAVSADGNTALTIAVWCERSPDIVAALLDLGADPLRPNGLGFTPYGIARYRADTARLALLEPLIPADILDLYAAAESPASEGASEGGSRGVAADGPERTDASDGTRTPVGAQEKPDAPSAVEVLRLSRELFFRNYDVKFF